jgi:putative oxidoreductase
MITIINRITRIYYNRSLGLLLVRLGLGLLFFTHGMMKFKSLEMTGVIFSHFGFYPWVGYAIAMLEVAGGLALILGVATRFFALAFGIEMLVAAFFVVGFGRGVNTELVLAFIALGLAFTGSGKFSIFKMECNNCAGMLCNGREGVCVVV